MHTYIFIIIYIYIFVCGVVPLEPDNVLTHMSCAKQFVSFSIYEKLQAIDLLYRLMKSQTPLKWCMRRHVRRSSVSVAFHQQDSAINAVKPIWNCFRAKSFGTGQEIDWREVEAETLNPKRLRTHLETLASGLITDRYWQTRPRHCESRISLSRSRLSCLHWCLHSMPWWCLRRQTKAS